jgi:hypothetical protein
MNILYSGCITDPWLDVAKKLQEQNNLNPVYWIGWNGDGEEQIIQSEFKDIVFHDISSAWKGNFPKYQGVDNNVILDNDFIERNLKHEIICIKMMDRLDPDRYSFNFSERQSLFRKLIRIWISIIDHENIEIVISPSIPHRVFDYALYVVCKEKGINFITYKATSLKGFLIPTTDIYKLPTYAYNYPFLRTEISDEIEDFIKHIQKDYTLAEPEYMKKQELSKSKYNIKTLAKTFSKKPGKYFRLLIDLKKPSKSYFKEKNQSIEKSEYSKLGVMLLKKKGRKHKAELKKIYESLVSEPDFSKKYIYVALHYQPEETSTPSGSFFTDQFLMIEMISKSIPKDWLVYVKEHKSQFHPLMEGETSRDRSLYLDILTLKNTKLIPVNFNSFQLIDSCQATATLTGTIGLESVIRKKPVLVFGNPWYSPLKHVFEIENLVDIKKAMDFIINGVNIEDIDVYNYLSHIVNSIGIKAYHYKGYKEISGVQLNHYVKIN